MKGLWRNTCNVYRKKQIPTAKIMLMTQASNVIKDITAPGAIARYAFGKPKRSNFGGWDIFISVEFEVPADKETLYKERCGT